MVERSAYTDPRWDPDRGGLRSDTCAAGAPGIAPAPGTIGAHEAASPEERRHREVTMYLDRIAEAVEALVRMEVQR